MGNCLDCFRAPEAPRDPLLDAEARQRAADAAAARATAHANSPGGKAQAKAKARDAAASRGGLSNEAHQQRVNDIIS